MDKKEYVVEWDVEFHFPNGVVKTKMLYDDYLKTDWWKQRSERTKKLAGYKCEFCGSGDGLQVHHLAYYDLGHEDDKQLLCLCRNCHERVHSLYNSGSAEAIRSVIKEKLDEAQKIFTQYFAFLVNPIIDQYGEMLEDAIVRDVYDLIKEYKGKNKMSVYSYAIRAAGDTFREVFRGNLLSASYCRAEELVDYKNKRFDRCEIRNKLCQKIKSGGKSSDEKTLARINLRDGLSLIAERRSSLVPAIKSGMWSVKANTVMAVFSRKHIMALEILRRNGVVLEKAFSDTFGREMKVTFGIDKTTDIVRDSINQAYDVFARGRE